MSTYFQPTQDLVILMDASHSTAIVAPAAGGPATILSKGAAALLLDAWFGAAPHTLTESLAARKLPDDVAKPVTSWMTDKLQLSFLPTPPAMGAPFSQDVRAGQDLPLQREKAVRGAGEGRLTSRSIGGWNVHLHESKSALPAGTVPELDGVIAFSVDGKLPIPQMQVMAAQTAAGCGSCGACGVCGGCALCAEINFYVGAAAATALAALVGLAAAVDLETNVA